VPHLSDWTIAGWIWEDCYAAVQQLYISDVMAKSATKYEFLDRGSVPSQVELPRMVVPRRWIEGGCFPSYFWEGERGGWMGLATASVRQQGE